MNRVIPRDSRDPWSLFLPVLLAVAAGILVADIVRHLAGAAFADDDVPAAAIATVPQDPADGTADGDAAADDAARVTVGTSSGGDVVLLPGPVAAMRDGAERACINDTIALRRPNGWEQGLEHSAPLRCRASSP
ncbi:hypothetical protein [Luteimonas sp. MC1750]|uniref:hypothetical protein n=1 Tax=Luteimonas sp. MC1750 TaxID=2799326 RepID=UPI0018F0A9C5|nr:hypothetical protein [Luteimonas sp. MC1750]MBJ6984516.1 hypothetical protein [Luteimonas sp. MC1750]QQO04874.1 hypothetical protein JGR68_08215 [Luteimonas sp. MC1750]